MNITGVASTQATSASGKVTWSWNRGYTALTLGWVNVTSFNRTAGFQGAMIALQKDSTNISEVASGNTTIKGVIWPYETFRFSLQGSTYYSTLAINFYQADGRAYILGFIDTAPDTLTNLDNFDSTFQG